MHTIETINYVIMCLFFVCYAYQFAYIPLAAACTQTADIEGGSKPHIRRPDRSA